MNENDTPITGILENPSHEIPMIVSQRFFILITETKKMIDKIDKIPININWSLYFLYLSSKIACINDPVSPERTAQTPNKLLSLEL